MRAAIAVVLLLLTAGAGNLAFAQSRTITGTVLDENSQPMPGATVMVEGTTNGTMTNADGTFVLANVPAKATVVVKCVGYKDVVLESGKTSYTIKLEVDATLLEETVVVAFGQQKKVSVTGSISTVSNADLRKTTATRLDNALAGRVTGLTSMQSGGGQPGVDGATMYLRGAATTNGKSPLILVDGVERDNIRTIDMNEVESLSVLKDASATALYGVQGANGVILIQTRRGQKGKPQLSISFDQSWTSFTREPSRLHSWEYCEYRNQALINDGKEPAYSQEAIDKYKTPLLGLDPSDPEYAAKAAMRQYTYCDNDYYRMYLKNNTPQTRVNANLSGGTDYVNYFLNIGYIHQGGNLNTEDPDYLGYDPQCYMNRLSLRSNLDFHITKSLTASLNLASYAENVNMPCAGSLYGGSTSWMITDLIYQCQTILPISPGPTTVSSIDDSAPAGSIISYNYLDRTAFEIINRRGFHTNKRKNLNSQFTLNWDLSELVTKGLSINGLVAYDTYNNGILEGYKNEPKYTAVVDYENDKTTYNVMSPQSSALSLSQSKSSNYQIYAQATINYNRTFGRHDVGAMINAYRKYWETTSAEIPYNVIGTALRATYSFDDRYLAEVNVGYNGSEQFAPGKRFGLFPSGSIGWVASNEGFLKNNQILTWLKFRASYGLVGNDSMGGSRFLFQDNIQVGGGTSADGLGGHTISEGLLGNKDLTWELAKKMNVAVEIGFIKDFRFQFDYYTENRDQILLTRKTIPMFQGVPSSSIPKVNMGVVENHGYEIEASYSHTFSPDFSFSIKGNMGFNKNKVIEYDEAQLSESYAYRYRTEGYCIGQQFGYLIDWDSPGNGYFTSQEEIDNYYPYEFATARVGDFVYKDVNGDGVIDVKDQAPIGYSTSVPGLNYGINVALNFKGFDFNVLFSGLGRYSKYYSGQGVDEFTKSGTFFDYHRNAWTAERAANGDPISYPALSTAKSSSTVANDFFIMNRSFLRLKNLEIGYTLPSKLLSKAGVKALRIYVAGQNLFCWDNLPITHLDPEQDGSYSYPITKNVSVGVNVNF
ncbi:MAG: SusC/RagA family TonB-linked outer membrane protein [Candidatus Cryptobacteroides sp.]